MKYQKQVFPVNSIRVCLAEGGEAPSGVLCAVTLQEEIPFHDYTDLILRINDAYDQIGQPQSYQVLRSFRRQAPGYNSYVGSPERFHSSEQIHARRGRAGTADLVMQTRTNAEWQGILKDMEGRVLGEFRTAAGAVNLLLQSVAGPVSET